MQHSGIGRAIPTTTSGRFSTDLPTKRNYIVTAQEGKRAFAVDHCDDCVAGLSGTLELVMMGDILCVPQLGSHNRFAWTKRKRRCTASAPDQCKIRHFQTDSSSGWAGALWCAGRVGRAHTLVRQFALLLASASIHSCKVGKRGDKRLSLSKP